MYIIIGTINYLCLWYINNKTKLKLVFSIHMHECFVSILRMLQFWSSIMFFFSFTLIIFFCFRVHMIIDFNLWMYLVFNYSFLFFTWINCLIMVVKENVLSGNNKQEYAIFSFSPLSWFITCIFYLLSMWMWRFFLILDCYFLVLFGPLVFRLSFDRESALVKSAADKFQLIPEFLKVI